MKVLASRHYSLLFGVIFAGVTSFAPSPAGAFELFGIHIFGKKADEADETIGEPQNYTVEFVVAGAEKSVEKTLKGASGLWQDREKPASGAAGLLAKARSDYKRLLAALYGQGRYGGTISITVDGREAADLLPDAAVAETASVNITVSPGPVFLFDKASVINRAPPPQRRDDRVPLPEDEGFLLRRSGAIRRNPAGRKTVGRGVAPTGPCQGRPSPTGG